MRAYSLTNSHPLSPRDAELFAQLAAAVEKRVVEGARDRCDKGRATVAALEFLLGRFPGRANAALSGAAGEEAAALAARLGLGDLLGPVAWLGQSLTSQYPGFAWRVTPRLDLYLTGAAVAPNLVVHLPALVRRFVHGVEGLSLVTELSRLPERVALAGRLAAEHDTAEAEEDFFSQYPGGVGVLPPDDLRRWVEFQAEVFRRATGLLAAGVASYDQAGLALCRRLAAEFRFVQPFGEAMAARCVLFAHEALRRHAAAAHPRHLVRWEPGAEANAPLRFAIEAPTPPRGDVASVLYSHPLQASLDSLLAPARHPGSPEEPAPLDAALRFLETGRLPAPPAAAAAPAVPEAEPRSVESPATRRALSSVPTPAPVDPGDTRPITLFDTIALNREVLEVRRRMVQRYSGDAPDLFMPCKRDLTQGARVLNVTPATGIFFESERELIAQLRDVYPRILEQIPNRAAPDYTFFFSFIEERMADLVVVLRKPMLFGGSLRTDFLLWELSEAIPGAPLSEAERRAPDLYDPVQRRIKEALFHLQYTGDATHARALLEEALERDPSRQSALLAMCQFHLAIGNQITARGYVQALLQVDPANIEARLLDARFLLDEDRIEEALAATRSLARDHPQHAEALVIHARCLAIDGQIRHAAETVERALVVEPSNPEAAMLKATLDGMERALP